jgi:hypothetical protein
MNKNSKRLEKLFKQYANDNNHLPFLFQALEITNGDVFELGMGHGSTPYLFEYCIRNKRVLNSYETNPEWANKFRGDNFKYSEFHINLISPLGWDVAVDGIMDAVDGVVLVDHAPGETRGDVLEQLKDFDGIVIAHDTEPGQADAGYGMRKMFVHYKYVLDFKTDGAWATVMSNKYDVTQFTV